MSIDAVFNQYKTNIALKPLWEAVLLNENGGEIGWTKPLITSITTPRLKLIVSATEGGAMKSYMGYELPDNISLTMYETADREVEKYLDGWMFGENGVFNKETGQFRTRGNDRVTNLYRGLKFTAFRYINDNAGTNTNVKIKENKQKTDIAIKQFENKQEIAGIVINEVENIIGRRLLTVEQERVGVFTDNSLNNNPMVNQSRILSIQQMAPQLTAIASQAANQVLGVVPGMFMPRVVIPPPLWKKPAFAPAPIPTKFSSRTNELDVQATRRENSLPLRGDAPAEKNEKEIFKGGISEEKKEQNLPQGQVKKYAHTEKPASITTYTCAIENYEPASYDYESGGPVTYTVNLSVINYKTIY